jgi:hypothetical protein
MTDINETVSDPYLVDGSRATRFAAVAQSLLLGRADFGECVTIRIRSPLVLISYTKLCSYLG